jgi:dipeptidyl aminopeptidase/acylaminoacyl peptidase
MSGFELSAELAARLEALVPPELTRGDWADVASRVRPRRRLVPLRAALALTLLVVLAAAATATYLVLRDPHAKPTPGALTVIVGGGSINSAAIVEVRAGGRLVPVWRCPRRQSCAELTSVAWAPDGRRLAFTFDSISCRCTTNGLHILDLQTGRDIHFAGAQAARLGCRGRGATSGSYTSVAWTPDSRTVGFVCATGLHTIRADGTHPRRLPTGRLKAGAFTWSPDGRWIAFEGTTTTTCCSIYVTHRDGSARRRIVRSGSDPTWSPDGNRIAYRADDGIRLVTRAGVDVTPGSQALGPRGAPAWSPDGRRLAIGTPRGVFVVPASGGRAQRVTSTSARGVFGLLRPAWYAARRAAETPTCGAC